MKPTILITGSSSGIGYDCARLLVAQGFAVIGSVRNMADGERVRSQLGASFQPLLLDVNDAAGLPAAVVEVERLTGKDGLYALVNNAGIASPVGPLALQPLSEVRAMFETNVFGLLAVTQAFLPLLGTRLGAANTGRVINISSVSGALATPFTGAYAASKFAVEAISDTLRRELSIYGITVSVIEPGPIRTPIWQKGEASITGGYRDGVYASGMDALAVMAEENARHGADVESVSRAVLKAITARRPKARYPLHPLWYLGKWGPTALVDRLLAAKLNLRPVTARPLDQQPMTRKLNP